MNNMANANINMGNMSAMGGPAGVPAGGPAGGPMGMMNNVTVPPPGSINRPQPQVQPMPPQMPAPLSQQNPMNIMSNRTLLNTYIYEYFLSYEMLDCARAILHHSVKLEKDSPGAPRDENGNIIGNDVDGEAMDTDNKDSFDLKQRDDFPAPKVPMPSDTSFLYDWFCLFWEMFNAQKGKGTHMGVNQYFQLQTQSRLRQAQQQDMLRQMRPDLPQQQYIMRMQNGAMMAMKPGNNLPRTAMANSQNIPQAINMVQKGQMQRDPSDVDTNRAGRPPSPNTAENAPSPSKRPRLDSVPFNPNQATLMHNGRAVSQGMPGQQVVTGPINPQVHQMLLANGINPASMSAEQLQALPQQSPATQAKTIQAYSQNLQQHHNAQLPNKGMPNVSGPPGQGSPMMPPQVDGAALNAYYNATELANPNGAMRGGPATSQVGGSNHALQDYQMQLMLLEQQNKKRLMMARQEQETMPSGPGRVEGGPGVAVSMPGAPGAPGQPGQPVGPGVPGGPGGPGGPNAAQPFQGTSPNNGRPGVSPNSIDQMKRNSQQMPGTNMGSPIPDNPQSRGSPNPVNFMGAHMDPSMAPNFYKGVGNMEGSITPQQMNGMRTPGAHPGMQFNGQMNPQMMAAARQQQQAAAAAAAQGGAQLQWQQPGGPPTAGNQIGGPQNPQGPPGSQGGPQMQGTPQQRSMPPPSAPGANVAANANQRTTASPQTSVAAPPTPQQSTKANPKKKDGKGAKKTSQKKSTSNLNAAATPAADHSAEVEPPTPVTPMTPSNPVGFSTKPPGPNPPATVGQVVPNGQPSAAPPPPPAPVAPQGQPDPNQGSSFGGIDNTGMGFGLDFADPLATTDVLNDFDFDTFLEESNDDGNNFDFSSTAFGMEGNGEMGGE